MKEVMNWYILCVVALLMSSCGGNATSDDPKGDDSTKVDVDTARADTTSFIEYHPCSFGINLPSSFILEALEEESNAEYCDYSVELTDSVEVIQIHSMVSGRFEFTSIDEAYQLALNNTSIEIDENKQEDSSFTISGSDPRTGNKVVWKRCIGANFVSDLWFDYSDEQAPGVEPYLETISTSFVSD